MQCCFAVILCEITGRISLQRAEFTAIFKARVYILTFFQCLLFCTRTLHQIPLFQLFYVHWSHSWSAVSRRGKKKDFIISVRGLTLVIHIAFTVVGKGALYCLHLSVLAGTTVFSTTEGALSLPWLKADGLTHKVRAAAEDAAPTQPQRSTAERQWLRPKKGWGQCWGRCCSCSGTERGKQLEQLSFSQLSQQSQSHQLRAGRRDVQKEL